MNQIEKRIIDFIEEHHIFTLATSYENKPYTCTCFYVYLEKENLLVFTSDMETRHIREIEQQNKIAGAIALETSIVGKIRGIQFTGTVKKLEDAELTVAQKAYIRRFPIAMLAKTTLWGINPDFIKMTDNRLGFGKKIIWEK